ncbi:MAG: type VI secretion system tip protein TssI/VgrG [Polyangiaceae bacterium]
MSGAGERDGVFGLAIAASGPADCRVVRVAGRERANGSYRFDVTFVARTDEVANPGIGAHARVELRSSEGGAAPRVVHGVVSRVRALGATPIGGDLRPLVLVRVVPRVALLALRKTSRIFQDKTVPEIVQSIVTEIGARCEATLLREYAKREYCVQYQETDHDFVRRLLAEEGIFTFFRHAPPAEESASATDGGREVLVLADAPVHYAPPEGEPIAFRDRGSLLKEESIVRFDVEKNVARGGVLVRGFDYERPKFVPVAEAHRPAPRAEIDESALRSYDHDRVLEPKSVPQRVADLRLDELRARARRARGESSVRRLVPGALFALRDHANAELNTRWVVTEIAHDGEEPLPGADAPTRYSNRFTCVTAGVPIRPARPERRPLQVTETAVVVGPHGEEIHTDALGRIKIQFHWDLEGKSDDHSSCWVRVLQPWAGTSWGSQFLPRVGMEVVVTFSGGDPDRPLVLGSVYNGVTPPPFALPGKKTRSGVRTRSTPGGQGYNELSFEDAAGAEQVYLHAERDFDEVVQHDHTRTVYGNEAVTVKQGRIMDVAQDNVRVVRGSEIVLVEKNFVLNIAGSKLIQVGRPPEKEEKQEPRALPEDASAYEKFRALASLPMFDDPVVARGARVRRSKLLYQSEQLDGVEYTESQNLVGQVGAIDKALEAIAGAVHLLTEDMLALPERVREAGGSHGPIAEVLARTDVVLDRAIELEERISSAIEDPDPGRGPARPAPPGRGQHLAPGLEKARAVAARVEVYLELLSNPSELLRGRGEGGGGGTDGKFKPFDVTLANYRDEKGAEAKQPTTKGSHMVIDDGPGLIEAPNGFKIKCGSSSIDITPGSITLESKGPIKIKGSEILLND